MKKLLVASHERSGTHFLINSIVNNAYGFYGLPNLTSPSKDVYHNGPYDDPEQYKNNIREFLFSYSGHFESKVFKTHHKAEFFEEYIQDLKREYHILYMHRNPLDVLTSLYHYYKNCEPGYQPHQNFDKDLDEFLFNKSPKDEWYSITPNESNAERLRAHVQGWRNLDVIHVSYEALSFDFAGTMDYIFNSIGLVSKELYQKPLLSGVKPRKGVVHDHVNLFSQVQINRLKDFFNV